jgi:glycosyltransferase involved in cell wall biosynthesis
MEDLVAKASEADVGVVPYLPTNLGNYYASPNKLFEYIQAGLVIAASNLPFLRKVLLEEEIGLTFDPEDPRDIAHVVNTLTREDNLMRLRGNVERAASKYNWEKEGSKLLYLYESVSKI